jgi:hypothetical protein
MGLIGVPPQPGGLSVMGSVKFQGGDFKEGSILVSPPYPGIPLGPWPAYLSGIGGGFGVDPLFIEADVNIGIFQVPPSYIFGIKGQFRITFGDPVTFEAHGQGSVYDFDIADVNFLLNTDGFIRLNGGLSIDLKVVSVSAGVDIFVDVPNGAFSAEAKGHLCIVGLCDDDSAVVLSSKGFGLCISLPLQPDHGAGYVWGDSAPDIDLLSCDLAKYEVPLPPGHRLHAAQAGPQTFAVAAGTKVEDLRLTGADGKAPHVSLVSPSGERIVPTTDQTAQNPRALAAYPADSDRSFVGIQNPDAGTWQVVPDDGYAITEVATTHDVPTPEVAGSVGGKGRKRLLSYRTTTGDGLATTFYEKGAMGMHELGTAKGTRGTIKFAPGDGKAGKRTIVAVVERDGVPRLQKTIGSYSAPGPQKPARVKSLKVTRRGHKLTATWRKAAGATMYGVRFDLPDGRRLLRITSGTKAALTDAPKRGRVTVTVTARNKGGRKGPSARARR